MSNIRSLVNGLAGDQINIQDRGLQYGHGVFETIAWRENKLELWNAHMERLCKSCMRLFIPIPDIKQLESEALLLCHQYDRAIIKITITCGESERGYLTPAEVRPNRIVSCTIIDHPQNEALESIAVKICSTRLAPQATLAGLKHLNRLEQVLARQEWREVHKERGYEEGLMLDYAGHVISGTMSNVYFARGGQIYTSKLDLCGVQGVMRSFIMSLAAKMQLTVNVGEYDLQEVLAADEVFISNSLIKIKAVKAIEGTKLVAPGPVTLELWEQLQQNLIKETLIKS